MNALKRVLIATATCACLALPLLASNNNSADEDTQSILKDLVYEIKRLRAKVAELEARLERVESTRQIEPATFNGWPTMRLPELKQVIELEPQRFDLPLNGDKGLYIFPGIDAPPLTPEDALRKRLGQYR